MQSNRLFSLITKARIVIYAFIILPALCLESCATSDHAVFRETEYGASAAGGTSSEGRDLQSMPSDGEQTGGTADNDTAKEPEVIAVFVCGAVRNEGVYELCEGSRVIDAVNAAGGFTDDADRVFINQAQFVYDAQRIEIPTVDQAEALRQSGTTSGDGSGGMTSGAEVSGGGKININTAGVQELMMIPGIGRSKAEKIIEYREENGRFGSIEEITNVNGIGDSMYEKMKDCIKT